MGAETKISWCDHTWSPWHGCAKVSAGCAHCYAEAMSSRNPGVLGTWGPNGTRVISKSWGKPIAWDRQAAREGVRRKVFPSLCDVFEDRTDLDAPRSRLLELIEKTPHLDWLLLTKRPESWRPCLERLASVGVSDGDCLAEQWLTGVVIPNLWLGVTTENQATADERIPLLLSIPARVRFLSVEPMLEHVDLTPWLSPVFVASADPDAPGFDVPSLDWIICGGESGSRARPFDVSWARSLRDQCQAAGVPFFMKQLGSLPVVKDGMTIMQDDDGVFHAAFRQLNLSDSHGADPAEWPADLRVQQFPEVSPCGRS